MRTQENTSLDAQAIWCETCSRLAPIADWTRKIQRHRVVVGTRVVGYVSTYEHRDCRVFTSVPVARKQPHN